MRRRAPAWLAASLVCGGLLAAPSALAAAPQNLQPYAATVDNEGAAVLADAGVDVQHTGFRPNEGNQTVEIAVTPSEAAAIERRGVDLEHRTLPVDTAPKRVRQAVHGGDSPNPYYTVYRSYSEEGGIEDEMRAIAREHRDIVKLVEVGRSVLNKPILALKITNDARNVPDTRASRCSTRRSTTRASGSRPSRAGGS
jgi:hypothetical protein